MAGEATCRAVIKRGGAAPGPPRAERALAMRSRRTERAGLNSLEIGATSSGPKRRVLNAGMSDAVQCYNRKVGASESWKRRHP